MREKQTAMKRAKPILSVFLFLSVKVAWGYQDGPYTYTVTHGEAIITDFDSAYAGNLVVTNSLDSYPVTAIGEGAFLGCDGLQRVYFLGNPPQVGWDVFS